MLPSDLGAIVHVMFGASNFATSCDQRLLSARTTTITPARGIHQRKKCSHQCRAVVAYEQNVVIRSFQARLAFQKLIELLLRSR